MLPAVHAQLCG
ncbi:hypothetical protein YPPY09_0694, partial [Yersinia pestis PY-09]